MARASIPAPVRLQRLYIGLLAITVAVSIISLASLLRVRHTLRELSDSRVAGPAGIEEVKVDVLSAAAAIHRMVGSSSVMAPFPSLAGRLPADGPGTAPFLPIERELLTRELARLDQLGVMARSERDRQRWEDLQIVLREADRTTDRIVASLDRELARIEGVRMDRGDHLQGTLLALGGLFVLTLLASVGIAAGLYKTWRRFERSILGI